MVSCTTLWKSNGRLVALGDEITSVPTPEVQVFVAGFLGTFSTSALSLRMAIAVGSVRL